MHEEVPFPNFAAYCASKGGMQMVMRNLAIEFASYGVRVNIVAPGAIKMPIDVQLLSKPELLQGVQTNISWGHLGWRKMSRASWRFSPRATRSTSTARLTTWMVS